MNKWMFNRESKKEKQTERMRRRNEEKYRGRKHLDKDEVQHAL